MPGDEFRMEFPKTALQDAVKEDRRTALEAIRDYVAYQLEAHLCKTCLASKLRSGDQASLVLRLTKVLEELEALPTNDAEVTRLELIRGRRDSGTSDAQDQPLGTKQAKRRSGNRRSGRAGGAEA